MKVKPAYRWRLIGYGVSLVVAFLAVVGGLIAICADALETHQLQRRYDAGRPLFGTVERIDIQGGVRNIVYAYDDAAGERHTGEHRTCGESHAVDVGDRVALRTTEGGILSQFDREDVEAGYELYGIIGGAILLFGLAFVPFAVRHRRILKLLADGQSVPWQGNGKPVRTVTYEVNGQSITRRPLFYPQATLKPLGQSDRLLLVDSHRPERCLLCAKYVLGDQT